MGGKGGKEGEMGRNGGKRRGNQGKRRILMKVRGCLGSSHFHCFLICIPLVMLSSFSSQNCCGPGVEVPIFCHKLISLSQE